MSKETFQWTDALIEEYITHRVNMAQYGTNSHHMSIELFKKAKMLNKKDYEVTEIINKHGGKITKAIDSLSWEDYCGLKSFDGFKINAVKRFPSNEIFEVGELVGSKHNSSVFIRSFVIHGNCIIVKFEQDESDCDLYWLTKLPPQSKPEQPKKERIEITQYSNINIPEEKFPAIKAALERVLNDEDGFDADLEKTIREADELKKP